MREVEKRMRDEGGRMKRRKTFPPLVLPYRFRYTSEFLGEQL